MKLKFGQAEPCLVCHHHIFSFLLINTLFMQVLVQFQLLHHAITLLTSPFSVGFFLFFFFFCSLSSTTLSYEVNVIPRFNFPAIFLERIIRSDLPVNLQALACRAERNFEGVWKIALKGNSSTRTSMGVVSSLYKNLDGGLCEMDKLSLGEFKEKFAGSNLGPLPQSSCELNSNWGVFGKVCRLDRACMVDEVHLRRFDGLLVTVLP
jgi:hypothetical protein